MTRRSVLALASFAAVAGGLATLVASVVAGADDLNGSEIARGAPAVVVGVRHRDGRSDVRGYGALDDGKVPNGDTAFELGSLTKTFTALLLARAVADGRVTEQTTLGALLASAPPGAGEGLPSTSPAASITILELATHTAGLPRLPANHAPKNGDDPYADYDAARLVSALGEVQLGERGVVEYSNFGVGALGYALTGARGGYAKVLADDVTGPLGLAHTTVFAPYAGARAATPHDARMTRA